MTRSVLRIFPLFPLRIQWAGIAHSVKRLATGWTVHRSNPGGGEIFHTRPDRPWVPPSLLYNGYRFFPGCKTARAWRWPPTPSSAEVKEREKLYHYSPSGPSWPVLGWTLPVCILPSNLPLPFGQSMWYTKYNNILTNIGRTFRGSTVAYWNSQWTMLVVRFELSVGQKHVLCYNVRVFPVCWSTAMHDCCEMSYSPFFSLLTEGSVVQAY